ncbi:hypothetical protein [Actinomadura sp. 9N407]|uniref:hypothetical protein n=1 Tax=Actinomadura sp. 9N407 TaxID=3375154 RepID=UPI0037A33594
MPQAPAAALPMPGDGPRRPGGPQTVMDGGVRAGAHKQRTRRGTAVLVGTASTGVVALIVLVGVFVWPGWPDASGASAKERERMGEAAGRTSDNPQGTAGSGAATKPGTAQDGAKSGEPSPSSKATKPGKSGGTGTDTGTGSGGGSGGGSGDAGGGGSTPTQPGPAAARIAYFTVGSSGKCYAKGATFPFRYRIEGKQGVAVQFALYFDGRLGRGHPISLGDAYPEFTISNSRSEETAGTHTYRMVLLKPVRSERTASVKVC